MEEKLIRNSQALIQVNNASNHETQSIKAAVAPERGHARWFNSDLEMCAARYTWCN